MQSMGYSQSAPSCNPWVIGRARLIDVHGSGRARLIAVHGLRETRVTFFSSPQKIQPALPYRRENTLYTRPRLLSTDARFLGAARRGVTGSWWPRQAANDIPRGTLEGSGSGRTRTRWDKGAERKLGKRGKKKKQLFLLLSAW